MIVSIGELIAGQNVVCIRKDEKVGDALVKMLTHGFSQLPIVNEQGNLTGIISEQSIIRTYYYINERTTLFDLPVHHCQATPVIVSHETNVFEALGRLQTVSALVIVRDQQPIGVVTHYDTTNFFRNVSEGLMYVEDVEMRLRQYIKAAFTTDDKLTAALFQIFGTNKKNPSEPFKTYDEFSFHDHIQFITAEKNWHLFEEYLQPKELFTQLMIRVRDIRNQLAHFRNTLDTIQLGALIHARDWLIGLPRYEVVADLESVEIVTEASQPNVSSLTTIVPDAGKITSLTDWFRFQSSGTQATISFDEIEALQQERLPTAAREHLSWWTNDTVTNRQSRTWLAAGWLVDDVDVLKAQVTFQKTVAAYYQLFFEDLINRINMRRPNFVNSMAARPKSWLSFGSGVSGFSFGWSFSHGSKFSIYLYIATGIKETNKHYFDLLHSQKQIIESGMKTELNWDRLDKKGASRISLDKLGSSVTAPRDQLEPLREWAVDQMLAFFDNFQPILQKLPNE